MAAKYQLSMRCCTQVTQTMHCASRALRISVHLSLSSAEVPMRLMHSSQAPRRVVCTGYGDGGAEAELCGLWAAVTYPAAQIRTVAFGAPVVRQYCCVCLPLNTGPGAPSAGLFSAVVSGRTLVCVMT